MYEIQNLYIEKHLPVALDPKGLRPIDPYVQLLMRLIEMKCFSKTQKVNSDKSYEQL